MKDKSKAFTLAEILIALVIIAIIIVSTMDLVKSKTTYYLNRFMSYSVFTALKQGVDNIIFKDGALPTIIHDTTHTPAVDGLCDKLADNLNTIGTVNCAKAAIGDGGPFTNAFFTTSNGIKFFFGAYTAGPPSYFTLYVDIDGAKRKAVLNDDVMKIYLYTKNGMVLPDPNSKGANLTDYLTASVRYLDDNGATHWVASGVNYRNAVCTANKIQAVNAAYCNAQAAYPTPAKYDPNGSCLDGNFSCEAIIDKPKY